MTNGEKIQQVFKGCEVCEPIFEDNIIHVIFADKPHSAIGLDWDWWISEYKEPTTKNDLPHCQHTNEEIAKSFIEDVKAVKDQLPCGEQMDFPNTFDEFAKDYGFRDKKEIYTNGSELIPVFRVKQWLEHISTTKNDLGVDAVSRKAVLNTLDSMDSALDEDRTVETYKDLLKECYKVLLSVTPQEPFINKSCVSSGVCEHDKNKVLDKIDEIITDALDKSTDQKESQTLRWVLDKISEVLEDGNDD